MTSRISSSSSQLHHSPSIPPATERLSSRSEIMHKRTPSGAGRSRSSEDLQYSMTLSHLFEFDQDKAQAFGRQLTAEKQHCCTQLTVMINQLAAKDLNDPLASQLRASARLIIDTPLVSLTDTEIVQDVLKSTRTIISAERFRDSPCIPLASKLLIVVAPLARLLRVVEEQRSQREEKLAQSGFMTGKLPRRNIHDIKHSDPSLQSPSPSSSSSGSPFASPSPTLMAKPSKPSPKSRTSSREFLIRSAASARDRPGKLNRAATLYIPNKESQISPRQAINKDLLQYKWMHMPKSMLTTHTDLKTLRSNAPQSSSHAQASAHGYAYSSSLSSKAQFAASFTNRPSDLDQELSLPERSLSCLSASTPSLPWLNLKSLHSHERSQLQQRPGSPSSSPAHPATDLTERSLADSDPKLPPRSPTAALASTDPSQAVFLNEIVSPSPTQLPSSSHSIIESPGSSSSSSSATIGMTPTTVPALDLSMLSISSPVPPPIDSADSEMCVCRICEQEMPEPLFLKHTDACAALAQREDRKS